MTEISTSYRAHASRLRSLLQARHGYLDRGVVTDGVMMTPWLWETDFWRGFFVASSDASIP
jgi:hypothetical protein